MHSKLTASITIAASLIAQSVLLAEENNTEDWINKHAAVKTTEYIESDAGGNVRSIKKIKETVVYVRQTVTEVLKPGKDGSMNIVSRVSSSVDTLGGSATITESLLPASSMLVTTAITTAEKTPEGMLTTVYARDKAGKMSIVSRTTALIQKNGVAPNIIL